MNTKNIIISQSLAAKIYMIRGKSVMLDKDLAELYNVKTKRLKEQVKRNIKRFPDDFMFILNKKEFHVLRSQIATSKHGGVRYYPMVFTEQGIAMLSSVLNSENAIQINIKIMRAFIKLRQLIFSNNELKLLIEKLERRMDKYDFNIENNKKEIQILAGLIKQMLHPSPQKPKKKIGFITD